MQSCPDLSKGEYWCSICSKPEQYLYRRCQEQPSHGSSAEELRLDLITGANQILSVLGIGSVIEVPHRNKPLSACFHSYSRLYGMRPSYGCEFNSHGLASKLDKTHSFPAFLGIPSHTSPSPAAIIPSRRGFQIPSIESFEHFQDASQISERCDRHPPINEPWHRSQEPSPVSWLRADWTTYAGSLPPTNLPRYKWSSGSIVSQSGFRQESIPDESILPTSSTDCSIDSRPGPTNPLVDRNFDDNRWRSVSGLFNSLNSTDLIKLFWNVLQEHVSISKAKIAQLHEIPSIRHLISMSSRTIAREGFYTLQQNLMPGGKEPTALSNIYAFVHVAYTSLVIFRGGNADNLKEMFVSLFQLSAVLESDLEKKTFQRVANAVWSVPIEADKAVDPSAIQQSLHPAPPIVTSSLIKACTYFLDRESHPHSNYEFY